MSEIGVLVGRCSPYHLRLSSPCHPLALPSCNCSLRAAADGDTEPVNFEILSLLIGNSNPFNNSSNCFLVMILSSLNAMQCLYSRNLSTISFYFRRHLFSEYWMVWMGICVWCTLTEFVHLSHRDRFWLKSIFKPLKQYKPTTSNHLIVDWSSVDLISLYFHDF